MLISTTTDVYGQLSLVSASTFNDILPYLILVIGIVVAFYVVERLIGVVEKREDTRLKSNTGGYHRLYGKSGQEIGWEKD